MSFDDAVDDATGDCSEDGGSYIETFIFLPIVPVTWSLVRGWTMDYLWSVSASRLEVGIVSIYIRGNRARARDVTIDSRADSGVAAQSLDSTQRTPNVITTLAESGRASSTVGIYQAGRMRIVSTHFRKESGGITTTTVTVYLTTVGIGHVVSVLMEVIHILAEDTVIVLGVALVTIVVVRWVVTLLGFGVRGNET